MSDDPPEDLIRYDILTQEAMRGVVKKIIGETAKAGLPGEHHFFISFLTGYPGVHLSNRMRERYPEEMTIVLQHQYWDLKANENSFEIGLSFDDIPENLLIPFAAIKGFFDPSVQFGLQFDLEEEPETQNNVTPLVEPEKPVEPEPSKSDTTVGSVPKIAKVSPPAKSASIKKQTPAKKKNGTKARKKSSAEVVSLDAFRKKP